MIRKIWSEARRHRKYILMASAASLGLFFYPILFFAIAIILIDLFVASFAIRIGISNPLDFILVGVILASYSGHIDYALFISLGYLLNGIVLADLNMSHMIKFPIFIAMCYLTFFLRSIPMFIVAVAIPLTRLILQNGIEFLIMEEIMFEKLLPRSIEVITTNLIVTLIYSFL